MAQPTSPRSIASNSDNARKLESKRCWLYRSMFDDQPLRCAIESGSKCNHFRTTFYPIIHHLDGNQMGRIANLNEAKPYPVIHYRRHS